MRGHAELSTWIRQSLLGRFKAQLRIAVCHWWAGCGFSICTDPYTILQELLDTPRVSRFASPWVFSRGRWVTVYYGWRPNLPDEGDNHLIELALAGGAQAIVTHDLRDLRGGELRLGTLRVLTPAQCQEEWE